mmetsp:Transcript_8233/g.20401  ORF Transcript_8233/g.20401 Transcript_8233/m.20401 type:complete len:275 (-) Transcript_8233:247-1071(-)
MAGRGVASEASVSGRTAQAPAFAGNAAAPGHASFEARLNEIRLLHVRCFDKKAPRLSLSGHSSMVQRRITREQSPPFSRLPSPTLFELRMFCSSAACTRSAESLISSCELITCANASVVRTKMSQYDTVLMDAAAMPVWLSFGEGDLPYMSRRVRSNEDSPKYSDSPIVPIVSPSSSAVTAVEERRLSTATVPFSMKWRPGDFSPSLSTTWFGGKTVGRSVDMSVSTTSHGSIAHRAHFCSTLRLSSIDSCRCMLAGSFLNSGMCERVTLEVIT